jgi:hypothetical protein
MLWAGPEEEKKKLTPGGSMESSGGTQTPGIIGGTNPQVNYKVGSGMPWRPGGGNNIPWRPGSSMSRPSPFQGGFGGGFNPWQNGQLMPMRPRWSPYTTEGNPYHSEATKKPEAPKTKRVIEGYTPFDEARTADAQTAIAELKRQAAARGKTITQDDLNMLAGKGYTGNTFTGKQFNEVMDMFFGKDVPEGMSGMGGSDSAGLPVNKDYGPSANSSNNPRDDIAMPALNPVPQQNFNVDAIRRLLSGMGGWGLMG